MRFGKTLNCSGLPDRTTLRRHPQPRRRPGRLRHCSGLPDRTTLRPEAVRWVISVIQNCSGLPDRTTLRRPGQHPAAAAGVGLFRSSRPDYIETNMIFAARRWVVYCSGLPDRTTLRPKIARTRPEITLIVPVFQAGLH